MTDIVYRIDFVRKHVDVDGLTSDFVLDLLDDAADEIESVRDIATRACDTSEELLDKCDALASALQGMLDTHTVKCPEPDAWAIEPDFKPGWLSARADAVKAIRGVKA